MGSASCESLLSLLLSSGLLRVGTYVPHLPLRVLFMRNATRPGLGLRLREEGSGVESRRNIVQASLGASKLLQVHRRYVTRGA